jgi:hypothetical protein
LLYPAGRPTRVPPRPSSSPIARAPLSIHQ